MNQPQSKVSVPISGTMPAAKAATLATEYLRENFPEMRGAVLEITARKFEADESEILFDHFLLGLPAFDTFKDDEVEIESVVALPPGDFGKDSYQVDSVSGPGRPKSRCVQKRTSANASVNKLLFDYITRVSAECGVSTSEIIERVLFWWAVDHQDEELPPIM